MIRNLLFTFLLLSSLKAEYKIIEDENIFKVELKNSNFEENLAKLKSQINFESFMTIYEINVANATNETALTLNKKSVLEKGINLGICKASFALQMLEENYNNINYCPLGLSVYQKENSVVYISFKKYKSLKNSDKSAEKINASLKNLIIESLD